MTLSDFEGHSGNFLISLEPMKMHTSHLAGIQT